jgi:hypothetical protein
MPAGYDDRRGEVVHDFPRVAQICLEEERFCVLGSSQPGTVIENPFGPVLHLVDFRVSGERSAELEVVTRAIAPVIDTDRKYQVR